MQKLCFDFDVAPFTSGVFAFTLQAMDSVGNIGVRTYTLTVAPVTVLTNTALVNGSAGVPYSQVLARFDAGSPVTWSVAPGSRLPPGLNVFAGGIISGTPTQARAYPF